ncbi:hypothetical protein [Streptomyces sp. NPDC047079]
MTIRARWLGKHRSPVRRPAGPSLTRVESETPLTLRSIPVAE